MSKIAQVRCNSCYHRQNFIKGKCQPCIFCKATEIIILQNKIFYAKLAIEGNKRTLKLKKINRFSMDHS